MAITTIDFFFDYKTPHFTQSRINLSSYPFFILTITNFNFTTYSNFKNFNLTDKFFRITFGKKYSNSVVLFFSNFEISKFFFFNFFNHYFLQFNSVLYSKLHRNSSFFSSSIINKFFTVGDMGSTKPSMNIVNFYDQRAFPTIIFKQLFFQFRFLKLFYVNTFTAFV
jgi:hypothetical protein